MNKITDWSQLPDFADERSEAAFWAIHQLDVRLMNSALQRQDVRESTTITCVSIPDAGPH